MEPKLEHPTRENARPPRQTWRILFLDNQSNVALLKAACTDVGYTVVGALTIEEANAFLAGKDHVDVIVCAAHLEDESMLEFLCSVRTSELHASAKFLILSMEPSRAGALLDRSTAKAGKALGADKYVVMPVFDAAELVAQIQLLQPAIPMLQQAETDGDIRPSR